MILNSKNQIVYPSDREIKANPTKFREVLQPSTPAFANMFNIEQRARITGAHK